MLPHWRIRTALLSLALLVPITSYAAPAKTHVISFGKWTTVQSSPPDSQPIALKVRPLLVDARTKEFTLGPPHDVTDRLFVVRRAFRVNDSLPDEPTPHWQWQRGGWLLVDRTTARISAINLPDFDVYYSVANWYRDYVAYCGVADDGKKTFAIVAQLTRRKPVLKKPLPNEVTEDSAPDSACPIPAWQRTPTRVSFDPAGAPKQTFAIRGHAVDLVNDSDEGEEGSK
jgi:hypothetical protein